MAATSSVTQKPVVVFQINPLKPSDGQTTSLPYDLHKLICDLVGYPDSINVLAAVFQIEVDNFSCNKTIEQ